MSEENTTPVMVSSQDLMVTANIIELIRKSTNDVMTNIGEFIPFEEPVDPVTSFTVGITVDSFLRNQGANNVK